MMSATGPAGHGVYMAFCPRCGAEMRMRQFRDKGSLDDMITGFTIDWWCRNCRARFKDIKKELLEK